MNKCEVQCRNNEIGERVNRKPQRAVPLPLAVDLPISPLFIIVTFTSNLSSFFGLQQEELTLTRMTNQLSIPFKKTYVVPLTETVYNHIRSKNRNVHPDAF